MSAKPHQREFDPQIVRSGGIPSRVNFNVVCSQCGYEKAYEANKVLPDEIVKKRFKQWGWLLGRNRAHDLCPSCVGVTAKNKLANKFKVFENDQLVESPRDIVEKVEQVKAQNATKVASILERHFGGSTPRAEPQKVSPDLVRAEEENSVSRKEANSMKEDFRRLHEDILYLHETMESVLDCFKTLSERVEQQDRLLDSLLTRMNHQVETTARLSSIVGKQSENINSAVNILGRNLDHISVSIDRVEKEIAIFKTSSTRVDRVSEQEANHEPIKSEPVEPRHRPRRTPLVTKKRISVF